MGGFDRARKTYGAASIFDDDGRKAKADSVDGGKADTVIVSEPGEKDAPESAFEQVAGQPGGGLFVVFEKSGVGVDFGAEAFAEDEFRG
jgi:hypothetical protein